MNREITEAKLKALMLEVWKVYQEYNPDGHYLNMCVSHGRYWANNSYYERDEHTPLNFNDVLPKEEAT